MKSLNEIKNLVRKIVTEELSKNQDPTKEEMMNFLEDRYSGLGFDEFSAMEAIYWFAYGYHGGQWSNLYSVLSTSDYTPSILYSSIEDSDDELSQDMYNSLVEKFA